MEVNNMELVILFLFAYFMLKLGLRYEWLTSQLKVLHQQCFWYSTDLIIRDKHIERNVWEELGVWPFPKMLFSFWVKDITLMTAKPEWARLVLYHKPSEETKQVVEGIEDAKKFVKDIMKEVRKCHTSNQKKEN
tara:strand:- start:929 stop:1330 length:402 start_codon:yes stop_codon:yes gene_type:complete